MATTKRKKKKKEVPGKDRALHNKLAFALGRTVQKVSRTVTGGKKTSKIRRGKKSGQKTGQTPGPFDPLTDASREPMSPVLKEIKAIADISGLTAAVEEMNAISLKHSKHPVISRLTARIRQMSPSEQEVLSRKFVDRLRLSSGFNDPLYAFPAPAKMTEEDCQRISDSFIKCLFDTLDDVGISPEEREFLEKFSNKMTRPINDLVQFYLHPRTFSQKVKRLWRMQRIFIRMIKLIRMTNALAAANAESLKTCDVAAAGVPAGVPANYWLTDGAPVVTIKGE